MARENMANMASGTASRTAPGGQNAPSRPVDLVHLSRYTLGERALEREVLELFATQSRICLERLAAAHSDKEWWEAAHSLKGSCNAIGAWRAAAAAEQAETLSGTALAQARARHLAELKASIGEANAFIAALLADR
jgi:HPt (histidine-containing phosphotransfer) domain-containing protein